jgi:hypothetical protein
MGNQKQYLESGGFSKYLYADESPAVTINGVTGKMISLKTDPTGIHGGLPTYANTCDVYFRKGEDGLASQAKIYKDRKTIMDFDWSHTHTNPDGTIFPKGTIHVQTYQVDSKGKLIRLSDKARFMTEAEIKKYGPIIKYFNKNVKFRP